MRMSEWRWIVSHQLGCGGGRSREREEKVFCFLADMISRAHEMTGALHSDIEWKRGYSRALFPSPKEYVGERECVTYKNLSTAKTVQFFCQV